GAGHHWSDSRARVRVALDGPARGYRRSLRDRQLGARLIRDTGAILLDVNPDGRMADNLRQTIEGEGDALSDLHLWRLGPGHLGASMSVCTREARGPDYYRSKLARFRSLSHLTIEVHSV